MSIRKWLVLLVLLFVSGGVLAGGGKVRGDEGQGSVVQVQVFPAETPGVQPWFVEDQGSTKASAASEETSAEEFAELGESF